MFTKCLCFIPVSCVGIGNENINLKIKELFLFTYKKLNIFIYCNWVPTRWQWSVNWFRNRKETAIYKRRNNTQKNTKAKNVQNMYKIANKSTKQENKYKQNIKTRKLNNLKITNTSK